MDKEVLRKWLKAGYVEAGAWYPTEAGTPQGGVTEMTGEKAQEKAEKLEEMLRPVVSVQAQPGSPIV
jgi:hypothetical protein